MAISDNAEMNGECPCSDCEHYWCHVKHVTSEPFEIIGCSHSIYEADWNDLGVSDVELIRVTEDLDSDHNRSISPDTATEEEENEEYTSSDDTLDQEEEEILEAAGMSSLERMISELAPWWDAAGMCDLESTTKAKKNFIEMFFIW